MLGFSLYPHHLRDGSDCTLEGFCTMIARTAEQYGVENLGIGSDLCQGQSVSVVEWMRDGRWTKRIDYGEGSATAPVPWPGGDSSIHARPAGFAVPSRRNRDERQAIW